MQELKGRSEAIFIVTIIFLGLSFVAVCLRCFVRLKLVKAFGWDDALMVFAMVCSGSNGLYSIYANLSVGIEYSICIMRYHGIVKIGRAHV